MEGRWGAMGCIPAARWHAQHERLARLRDEGLDGAIRAHNRCLHGSTCSVLNLDLAGRAVLGAALDHAKPVRLLVGMLWLPASLRPVGRHPHVPLLQAHRGALEALRDVVVEGVADRFATRRATLAEPVRELRGVVERVVGREVAVRVVARLEVVRAEVVEVVVREGFMEREATEEEVTVRAEGGRETGREDGVVEEEARVVVATAEARVVVATAEARVVAEKAAAMREAATEVAARVAEARVVAREAEATAAATAAVARAVVGKVDAMAEVEWCRGAGE